MTVSASVSSTDLVIAKSILNFLVENDLSLMDVIEALIICQKVEGLDYAVKQKIKSIRDEYQQALGATTLSIHKKQVKKPKRVIVAKVKKPKKITK
jgi:hypothetical protein